MALSRGPKIVTSGLVLALDAADRNSYSGTGTTWNDLSGNNNNATIYNSPTWNTAGYFVFNGTNNYVRTTNTLNLSTFNAVTVIVVFQPLTYPSFGQVKAICELTADFNSFTTGFVYSYNDTSLAQNYEIFTSIKGDVGYNIGVWNKSNFNNLTWKNTTAIFDKSQSSAETSLYVQGNTATVISNPAVGYSSNNTNNFANDYFYIGCRGGSSLFSDMNLSSVLVYNRVLSATEILRNYNATKTRFGL
jgi:hypothetical protein